MPASKKDYCADNRPHKQPSQYKKSQPIEQLKIKEFLTVKDVALLLQRSIRSDYYIGSGNIFVVNLGQRIIRVKRYELDKLFEQPVKQKPNIVHTQNPVPVNYTISECYNLTEVQIKYGISEKGLYDLLKRNNNPKLKREGFAYVPRTLIDKLLNC